MFRAVATALVFALVLACAGPLRRDPGALAAAYADAGRHDEAAREIELATRSRPQDLALRHQAARIHAKAGNTKRAISHLEAAIQFAPENPESWIELGEIESERSNVSDAYVAYRRAAQLAPHEIRALRGLALTADSLGFKDEAEDAYARWAEAENEQKFRDPEED